MPMRVIAGSAKGRKLKLVPGDSTRPIMDRVKEALFSILGQYIVGARFLDLFAGTGSVGIEALSRGAGYVLLIDRERIALQTIRENLQATQLQANAEVRMVDALEMLKRPADAPFDYIYIAPPQYKGLWRDALLLVDAHPDWLSAEGIIIIQIDPKEQEDLALHHLKAYDERRYGKTLLWFFEKISADDLDNSEE